MKKRFWWLAAFLAMALLQLYVPAQMIWSREEILAEGKEFKFRTAAFDPYDPFRGKYITLNFEQNRIKVPEEKSWPMDAEIYVHLKTDKAGFARVVAISTTEPQNPETAFLKAKVDYVSTENEEATLFIAYPFDRFYLEESLAPEAEKAYLAVQRDSSRTPYALVSIKNGQGVLKDVLIDEVPLTEIVKTRQRNSAKK